MHTVLENSPISAFTIDLADRVTAWNAAAVRYFDVPKAMALAGGFRDLDISYLVPGLRAAVEAMKLVGAPDAVHLGAVKFVHRAGLPAEAVFTITPISQSGELAGVCIWVEDLASSRDLEATIEALSCQLNALSGAHEDLQTINEELRTSREQLQELCVELERANGALVLSPISRDTDRRAGSDGPTVARDNGLLRTELAELRDTHTSLLATLRQLQGENRRLRDRLRAPTSD